MPEKKNDKSRAKLEAEIEKAERKAEVLRNVLSPECRLYDDGKKIPERNAFAVLHRQLLFLVVDFPLAS